MLHRLPVTSPWQFILTSMPWVAIAVAATACGGGSAPTFEPVGDRIAQVGTEISIELRAADSDGDGITYDYEVNIPDIHDRATLSVTPNGSAIFRWTPQALDIGQWHFDFKASDSDGTATETVLVDVRSAVGAASAPQFRKPLGTGTTLDLDVDTCLNLEVVIEDQDNTEVDIAQAEPIIEGAELEVLSGLTANWRWCPDEAQSANSDRYTLTLSADDLANPKTVKNYLVVVRAPGRADCPGEAPLVDHTPTNVTSILSVIVDADILDDVGLKQAPLFYYSLTDPGPTPNLGAMTQLTMLLIDGDNEFGTWAADVPNPVASMPAGTSKNIYYVIVADDDDDTMGSCDHTTKSPATGSYQMTVTSSGAGDAGLCNSCTADVQCGNDGDLCARVGSSGDSYCLESCSGATCPTGFTCSTSPITSVNGASSRQCIPDTGTCQSGGVCVDDNYEDNDSRSQASANPALPADLYELTSCPAAGGSSDDEDWFKVVMPQEGQYEFSIVGSGNADLDLALYRSNGTKVAESTSISDDETLVQCLSALTYYVRVFNIGTTPDDYLLEWRPTGVPCSTTCIDDASEDDDTPAMARFVSSNDYNSLNNKICQGDKDFFAVEVSAFDELTVDLTFTHSPSGDIDVHLYDPSETDLTPCPPCEVGNGQSGTSNEHFEFEVPASCGSFCTYYVAVQGYADSSNSYGIRIQVQ